MEWPCRDNPLNAEKIIDIALKYHFQCYFQISVIFSDIIFHSVMGMVRFFLLFEHIWRQNFDNFILGHKV